MKQVIVNADDFGFSPGINQGIIEAHRKGIVTSTTVMVNMPYAAPGLEEVQRAAPNLAIGLHLNLTAGRPVSAPGLVPSLLNDEGSFYHISQWPAQFRQFDPDHLQREIAAQVARFSELTGHAPDHLDAHHHAPYMHPITFQAMLEHAYGLGIPMREDATSMGHDRALAGMRNMLPGLGDGFVTELLDQLDAIAAQSPAPFCPAQLTMNFYGDHATLGDLLVILTTLPDDRPLEIMCHPGYIDDTLANYQGYAAKREEEVAHLTHRATNECVQSEGIQLVTFADFPRG